jgi:pyrroline-5-carboxylate reductase
MKSSLPKLTILGAGNMGQAIADGLTNEGVYHPSEIMLTNIDDEALRPFDEKGFQTSTDNMHAVQAADIILLAVKPQTMNEVLTVISSSVSPDKLIISIAAGLPIRFFSNFFQSDQPIIRVMPNLCAQVNESMSAWVANSSVSDEQKRIVNQILSSFGKALELETEEQMNAVTAVSGSGPAYIFYLTEIFQQAACNAGLKPEDAQKLILQTLRGSLRLMEASDKTPVQLREAVTSKGGTTEAALELFFRSNIDEVFNKAVQAASQRAKELEMVS